MIISEFRYELGCPRKIPFQFSLKLTEMLYSEIKTELGEEYAEKLHNNDSTLQENFQHFIDSVTKTWVIRLFYTEETQNLKNTLINFFEKLNVGEEKYFSKGEKEFIITFKRYTSKKYINFANSKENNDKMKDVVNINFKTLSPISLHQVNEKMVNNKKEYEKKEIIFPDSTVVLRLAFNNYCNLLGVNKSDNLKTFDELCRKCYIVKYRCKNTPFYFEKLGNEYKINCIYGSFRIGWTKMETYELCLLYNIISFQKLVGLGKHNRRGLGGVAITFGKK